MNANLQDAARATYEAAPCPFCKISGKLISCMGEWVSREVGYGPDGSRVVCPTNGCGLIAGRAFYGPDKEREAVEWWNSRLTTPDAIERRGNIQPAAGEGDVVERIARAIDPAWWEWHDVHWDASLRGDPEKKAWQLARAERVAALRPADAGCVEAGWVLVHLGGRYTVEGVMAEMLAVATASITEDEQIMDDWPLDCRADVDRWQAVLRPALSASVAIPPSANGELDGNEVWEALFGILKGNVPDEMTEDVCQQLADGLNAAIAAARPKPEVANHVGSVNGMVAQAGDGGVLEWAKGRWFAEVSNRPLNNKNRRPLDDAWRQVVRFAGGDDVTLLGPAHDDLVAALSPATDGGGAS